jgi:hypothetical protein
MVLTRYWRKLKRRTTQYINHKKLRSQNPTDNCNLFLNFFFLYKESNWRVPSF